MHMHIYVWTHLQHNELLFSIYLPFFGTMNIYLEPQLLLFLCFSALLQNTLQLIHTHAQSPHTLSYKYLLETRVTNFEIIQVIIDASLSTNTCGRTVRNNMLSEALVFHQTLSTPKVSYIGQFRRAHPTGELESIHILPPESNNEYELIILSPFHTTRVLRNYLL